MKSEDFERVEQVSDIDMQVIELSRDVLHLGAVIASLDGSMRDRVIAAICAEKILYLHGIETSGTGYWRDGKVIATHEELDEPES